METKIRFAKLTSLALLVATLTIYTASRAGASSVHPAYATTAQSEDPATEFESGGISIGRGQTASIIAILRSDPNARDEQPVEVEFMFHDWDGDLLASETKTLLPGRASSFEIRAGVIAPGRTARAELQPCIKVLVDPSDPRANRIVANVDVYDTETGKTQFALNCRKAGEKPVEF
jgi:hypothetical protein